MISFAFDRLMLSSSAENTVLIIKREVFGIFLTANMRGPTPTGSSEGRASMCNHRRY